VRDLLAILTVLLGAISGMGLEDSESLGDLLIESGGRLEEVNKLTVVHLEEHTGDLTSKHGLLELDEGEQTLTDHLLAHLFGSGGEGLDGQRLSRSGHHDHRLKLRLTGLRAGVGGSSSVADVVGISDGSVGLANAHLTRHAHLTGAELEAGLTVDALLLVARTAVALARSRAANTSGNTGANAGVDWHELIVDWHGAASAEADHLRVLGVPAHHVLTRIDAILRALLGRNTVEHHGVGTRIDAGGGGASENTGLGASGILGLELSAALLLALGESDIEGLAIDHATVELSDSLGGLLGSGEADKAEASRLLRYWVHHDHSVGDVTELGEFSVQTSIIEVIRQVLDIEVDAGILLHALHLELLELLSQLLLTLLLLLGARDIEAATLKLEVVQTIDGGSSLLWGVVVDEAERSLAVLLVNVDDGRCDLTELTEERLDLLEIALARKILTEHVGELELVGSALLLGLEVGYGDFLTRDDLSIDLGNGGGGGLLALVVNETITERLFLRVSGDLAGQNVTKHGESIIKLLVVDGLGQMIDENITETGATEGRIAVRPHNAARLVADVLEVEQIKSALGIVNAVEVDISITERSASGGVAADTNGGNRTNSVENLEQKSLSHIRSQITDIQRSGGIRGSGRGGRLLSSSGGGGGRAGGGSSGGGRGHWRNETKEMGL
jgi:hypothetical protein